MLFYASEKYPLEDSYSKYIAEVTFGLLLLVDLAIVGAIVFFFFLSHFDFYRCLEAFEC